MQIQINHLYKTISKNEILKDITLEMESGLIYGLRGKNGSGKTMLMRCICGLISPTKGEVVIDGETLGKEISFPRSVGALIENPGFISSYSAYKNLEILAAIQNKVGKQEIVEILNRLGLDPEDKKKFRKFSLGMKQKLGIAAALMENPDLIILDEPINALDEKTVAVVKELLIEHRDRGALIVLSCHDREELEFLSDKIFTISDGEITGEYEVGRNDGEAEQ